MILLTPSAQVTRAFALDTALNLGSSSIPCYNAPPTAFRNNYSCHFHSATYLHVRMTTPFMEGSSTPIMHLDTLRARVDAYRCEQASKRKLGTKDAMDKQTFGYLKSLSHNLETFANEVRNGTYSNERRVALDKWKKKVSRNRA